LPRLAKTPTALRPARTMSSTSVVVELEDGKGLAPEKLAKRLAKTVPASKEEVARAVEAKDTRRVVSLCIEHLDDILAKEESDSESGGPPACGTDATKRAEIAVANAVLLHLFAIIPSLDDHASFAESAVVVADKLVMSTSSTPARRLKLLVHLYNALPNRQGAKLHALLNLVNMAVATGHMSRLEPFLRDAASLPTRWGLSTAEARAFLLTVTKATEAIEDLDRAQSLRTAYLLTFDGESPAALREARAVALDAAAAYVKAPLVSQRSNLPSLDAVSGCSCTPLPASLARRRSTHWKRMTMQQRGRCTGC
jgi:hypothetical protein